MYNLKFLPESACNERALCQRGFLDFLRAVLPPIRILGLVASGTSVLWRGKLSGIVGEVERRNIMAANTDLTEDQGRGFFTQGKMYNGYPAGDVTPGSP